MKRVGTILFITLFLGMAARAESPSLRAILINRYALKLLHDQKPEEALEKFSEASSLEPKMGAIQLNMGLAFEALGQPEKALQAYRTAEQLADSPDLQFMARFNQGALHQKAEHVDEALTAYHAALEVNPESRETKINIELLIQKQQQNQSGQGEGKQDKPQDGKDKDKKGQGDQDNKDQKDQKDQGDKGDQKKDQPKQYAKNKPQPRPFKSEDLTQGDVNKILGEIRNQEQKIRTEYNKREVKEKPRDKDW